MKRTCQLRVISQNPQGGKNFLEKIKLLFFLLTNVYLSAIIVKQRRKVSSVGRASALQAEGHRFEPCTFHQRNNEARGSLGSWRLEVGAVVNDS